MTGLSRYHDAEECAMGRSARQVLVLVVLTGQNDPNREQTKVNAEAFRKDGFQHLCYIEVPAMGHQPPDGEWFDKGIEALEPAAKAQQ
jgi:hypothetical protein